MIFENFILKLINLIDLKYAQVFGSLLGGVIASQLNEHNQIQENYFSEYLPLQINRIILNNIITNENYYDDILSQKMIQVTHEFDENELAIALFPLIIYCYQDIERIEQELNNFKYVNPTQIRELDNLKILIIIVYLILDNQCNNQDLVIAIKDKIEIEKEAEITGIQLIEDLIKSRFPLTQVERQITRHIQASSRGIYQALYSFLSMPENVGMSLQRSRQFSQQRETTMVLTALLLGLKQGYLQIPAHWRQAIAQQDIYTEIAKLSQQLVARWRGKLQYSK